jgi:hypothetical protein
MNVSATALPALGFAEIAQLTFALFALLLIGLIVIFLIKRIAAVVSFLGVQVQRTLRTWFDVIALLLVAFVAWNYGYLVSIYFPGAYLRVSELLAPYVVRFAPVRDLALAGWDRLVNAFVH